jgi:methylenetetrahydrofolate reductase (NADPH)
MESIVSFLSAATILRRGGRSTDLTVRRMIDEAHGYPERSFRVGATIRVGGRVPSWKANADFLLVQVSYDLDRLSAWRDTISFPGKVLAGVMVMASSAMAKRIAADVPEIGVPDKLIDDLESNPDAGVDLAVDMVDRIRNSGQFDGVHLVPVGRYADIANRLRRRERRT